MESVLAVESCRIILVQFLFTCSDIFVCIV